MLQKTRPHSQNSFESSESALDLGIYVQMLKRRFLLIVIPFILVFAAGATVAMLLPPIYLSQGRILVESQQIPTDLVRPTITASAKERIQVIEQRVMSRENLLAIAEKYEVFGDKRQRLSGTEIYDTMRNRSRMQPFELDSARRRDGLTIAVTVSFEHERPDVAMRVANELVTLMLREDARNRTNRAAETTKFLAREVRKHEEDLIRIDAQIFEARRRNSDRVPDRVAQQLLTLQADLAAKSTVYSEKHPDLIRLKQQIDALEKLTTRNEVDGGFEALQNQRAALQKNLDAAAQRLEAARIGESLERDQFSERLEVLEQAVTPQKPIKPNRMKLLATSLALAAAAGFGCMFVAEAFDKSIRSRRDLLACADGALIVAIPYIATKAETRKKRGRIMLAVGTSAATVIVGLIGTHLLFRPLDELWSILLARLMV
jgi:uncharacterized protein involved in exopolysaccharide biosynthesis